MLDRGVYISMTGAKHAMGQLATTSNNLANANTPGFREMLANFRAVPLEGPNADSRAFVVDSTPGAVFAPGAIQTTDNPFDAAIRGNGFFVVRRSDGSEAYTRNGRFYTDNSGVMRLSESLTLVGTSGDITLPVNAQVQIGKDGIISARVDPEIFFTQVGQMRLVNPDPRSLVRSADGLFEPGDGQQAEADPSVEVVQGAFEGSNVNPTTSMVQMIDQTRLFELNMKAITTADQDSRSANVLLSLSRT